VCACERGNSGEHELAGYGINDAKDTRGMLVEIWKDQGADENCNFPSAGVMF